MKKIILVLSVLITFLNAGPLGIEEKLGQTVPLDLTFINEKSERVTLKELMDGKPTILTLNYFRCAGICSPQLNDLAKTVGKIQLAENTDYKVITVSFAENETPELAAAKRKNQLESIGPCNGHHLFTCAKCCYLGRRDGRIVVFCKIFRKTSS